MMRIVEVHPNGSVTAEVSLTFYAGSTQIAQMVERWLLMEVGTANVVEQSGAEESP